MKYNLLFFPAGEKPPMTQIDPGVTVKPPTEPYTDKCYCQRVEDWPFGVVECDPSLSNGLWKVGDQCRYECDPGKFIIG